MRFSFNECIISHDGSWFINRFITLYLYHCTILYSGVRSPSGPLYPVIYYTPTSADFLYLDISNQRMPKPEFCLYSDQTGNNQ